MHGSGFGFVAIPRDQAAQLTEITAPIPGMEDHYLVGIDVFHQLHCLDLLRQAVWPDRYNWSTSNDKSTQRRTPRHLDHCVDSLRQSLMCSADISTLHFEWVPKYHRNYISAKATHTCRNFEKIRQWTKDKTVPNWDPNIFVEDSLRAAEEFAASSQLD